MTTSPPEAEKSFATLQAAAALRGIAVEREGHGFVVRMQAWEREVPDMDSLVALLARMGVTA